MASTSTSSLLIWPLFISIVILASGPLSSQSAKTFTIINHCNETIWPAMTQPENFSGGALKPGQSTVFTAAATWHGRIWARTGCDFDSAGTGRCETGGCSSALNCSGPGAPPATTADFTLGSVDYYDVSLVDGFNVPVIVQPSGGGAGTNNCSTVGCELDLRLSCALELQQRSGGGGDGRVVACRSACSVFGTDEYCCRGTFGNPATCLPTNYSRAFKQFCPEAYSYAYDDPTSVKTCSGGAGYTVSFCGSRNQTVCSYHDNRLICNESKSSKAVLLFQSHWWSLLLILDIIALF